MAIPDLMREKAIAQLSAVMKDLSDFEGDSARVTAYVEAMIVAMSAASADKDSFRDQLMSVLANVRSLDGEFKKIEPSVLATMKPQEILSSKQKRDRSRFLRKRAREQTVYDATCMLCSTCKLVRADRLNINHLALDSEENGTQFEYNFDNICQCSHSSEENNSSDTEDTESSSESTR